MTWRPSASLDSLRARAQLYQQVRAFFAQRRVLEIEAPVVGAAAVTDPYIDSISVVSGSRTCYLQTSPEFAMKRLLAAGSGAIYSLGKVFRNGEKGRRHNPEFTLLEWYRPGFDDHQLMAEVAQLLEHVLPGLPVQKISYRDWFKSLHLDPHTASVPELEVVARQWIETGIESDDRNLWLDLLVTHVLEPKLDSGLVFVYDYPAGQAALARITPDASGQPVARRFEAFLNGMELANGYWELTDASEQAERFEADLARRSLENLPVYPSDQKLLQALEYGLPDSAGVALGVDRLLMCITGAGTIGEVIAFDFEAL
ncbi:EF-P lysine aminoacylase EpmA [Marinimicrobium sp. ABcell2]|uniref:EF-P lysine aminoacylase EpmA n=1 Tax=Marinimicrobium sp. ABcell2 TaxID=3069751 RepID=UPI0027B3C8C2|nr:EF-P lysine aminoacylase EpmA [Marinimicrobium sp. ABcell2]MDQ2076468.1 EF-P lysine aminoacylase EpmA [Marinimicrobium sp. ABcell2]